MGKFQVEPGPELPKGLVDIFEYWRRQPPSDADLRADLQADDPFRKARGLYLGHGRGLVEGPLGLIYPWGKDWDGTKCRHNRNKGNETTAQVYDYSARVSGYGTYNQHSGRQACSTWAVNTVQAMGMAQPRYTTLITNTVKWSPKVVASRASAS